MGLLKTLTRQCVWKHVDTKFLVDTKNIFVEIWEEWRAKGIYPTK